MLCPWRQGCPRAPRPLRCGPGYLRVEAVAHLRPPSWVTISEGKCSSRPPGQWLLVTGGDPGKEQTRWEPQEPPVWPLGPFLVNKSLAALSCMHLKEGTSGPTSTSEKRGDGSGAGTDRRQDTAHQRQNEVRDPGPKPLSAIS